jgi:hypothetical protein
MNLILRAGRRFNPKRRRANAEFPPPDRADALMLALCRPYQKFEFYSIRDLQHRSRSAGPDPRENPYWSFTELGDDDDGVDKRRSLGGLGREASIASRQGCELGLLWIETPGAQDDAEPQEMLGVASARDLRSRMDPESASQVAIRRNQAKVIRGRFCWVHLQDVGMRQNLWRARCNVGFTKAIPT